MQVTASDELFHERSDDPGWNESAWFSLAVPERELSGFVYTHHRPNRGYTWAGVGLWDAGHSQPHDCLWHDYTVHPLAPGTQAVGRPVLGFSVQNGLAAATVAPLEHYRLRYDAGRCRADLEWRSVAAPIAPGLAEGWGGFGAGHFEQPGRMRGEVLVEGERIEVDCFSIRDRSWGPHKPTGLVRGGYPWAIAGPGQAFQVQAVSNLAPDEDPVVGTTEPVRTGWHLLDGEVAVVTAGERTVERAADGRPIAIHLETVDARGRHLRARGRCVNWLQFSFTGMYWWWCLTEWDLGEAPAWGEEIDFFAAPAYRRFARSLNYDRGSHPMTTDATASAWGPLAQPIHREVAEPDQEGISWWDYALFTWWDPASEVYVMTHHMTSPHAPVPGRSRVSVAIGDRRYEVIEEPHPQSLNSDSITVDLDGRLRVDHPRLQLDVKIEPAYGPIDFHALAGLPTLKKDAPLHHYEQPIATRGTVSFPGVKREFNGRGLRDRTWGYRNESAQWAEYIYLMAQLEESFLVLMRMRGVAEDQPKDLGFVLTASGQERVDFRFARDGAGLMADCEVQLPAGTLTLVAAEKPAGFWVPMGGRQTGPTFSAYDEFVLLDGSNGGRYAGLATHGVLRHI